MSICLLIAYFLSFYLLVKFISVSNGYIFSLIFVVEVALGIDSLLLVQKISRLFYTKITDVSCKYDEVGNVSVKTQLMVEKKY